MFGQDLVSRAAKLLDQCRSRGLMLTAAESCTGGLVAALLTEVAGSSAVFDRGFVTYSNQAKEQMLGVPADVLLREGAVSAATALAMAAGALHASRAALAVSITGVAGPGGGSAEKPVGLVHFACCGLDGTRLHVERRFDLPDRTAIRLASVTQALQLFERALQTVPSRGARG